MDNKEKFKSDVEHLAELQEKFEVMYEDIKKEKAAFEKTIENKKEAMDQVKKALEDLKEDIVEEGLKIFKETDEKSLYGGLKVQNKTVKVYDEAKAFGLAKEKKMFLQLDKKAFEKVASSLDLDFYEEKIEQRITFPKVIKLED